jgi:hypothetical protein
MVEMLKTGDFADKLCPHSHEERQRRSNPAPFVALDCFASLAMTESELSPTAACAGLTRASIHLHEMMDFRVKPGNDDGATISPPPTLPMA